jgi:DNA-binding transcriptional LysR family regulator
MTINRPLSSLDDLTVFLAVVHSGGFRRAATQLGSSPSSVSERISRLEAELGVPLLLRTTRSVMPTEAGRALAERLQPLWAETAAAVEAAVSSAHQVRGLLKLNVPGAVMVDILPPLIDRFLTRHPEVQVEIMVDDQLVDVTAAGCAAGIRYGEYLAQDMIAVPIGPAHQQAALAAAPEYLARHGVPQRPEDILRHACIRMRFSSGALTEWSFCKGAETVTLDPPARLVVATSAAAAGIGHAVAGQGLLLTFRNWLEPHFAQGTLVPVLPEWWPRFDGPQLYFSSRFMPASLRAFVDLITEDRRGSPQDHQRDTLGFSAGPT